MKQEHDYRQSLAHVRELRGTVGVDRVLVMLGHAVELWKEQAIGKPADQVAQLHGAILKVREVMADVSRDLPDLRKRDGGYV